MTAQITTKKRVSYLIFVNGSLVEPPYPIWDDEATRELTVLDKHNGKYIGTEPGIIVPHRQGRGAHVNGVEIGTVDHESRVTVKGVEIKAW